MRNFYLLNTLCILIISHFSFAANDSITQILSKKSTQFYSFSGFGNSDSIQFLNYSLNNYQNYYDKNYFGNDGLPLTNFIFNTTTNDLGFRYYKNNYSNYFYSKVNSKFYDSKKPFTDLLYVAGSKKEQVFRMTFSTNVKSNWNVSLKFDRIRSEGFYLRQKTNDNFISLTSNYKSKSNRYWIIGCINYNNVKNEESGGLKDSLFENSVNVDKKLFPVKLASANKNVKNRSINVKQFLNIGLTNQDSTTHRYIIPKSVISLSSSFSDNSLKYTDDYPLAGYYSSIYFDSTKTLDSTYFYMLENELAWNKVYYKNKDNWIDRLGYGAFVKHQFVKLNQYDFKSTFNNTSIGGSIYNFNSPINIQYKIDGEYFLSGYNKNDYYLSVYCSKSFKAIMKLVLKAKSGLFEPDFFFQRYHSNNFSWENTFTKTNKKSIEANFLVEKFYFALSFNYSNITNLVYFDNYAAPKQLSQTINIFTSTVKKNFSLYNWHFNNCFIYQLVPDSTVVRLPKFSLENSLFYENKLFHSNLKFQIGASLSLFSSYYSDSYMPATGQFYLQNKSKYGNYPLIDFFLNTQIKSVRIFFKIDHINEGLMGNNYILVPNYPMNGRAFKIGIGWRFFD